MSWPGLGPLLLEAILARDVYVVLGPVMASTLFLLAGNLVADVLLYAVRSADPARGLGMTPRRRWTRLAIGSLSRFTRSSLLAGFLAPYDPTDAEPAPAVRAAERACTSSTSQGRFHMRPFVYALVEHAGSPWRLRGGPQPRATRCASSWPARRYRLCGVLPARTHLFGVDEPGRLFLLGHRRSRAGPALAAPPRGADLALRRASWRRRSRSASASVLGTLAGFYGGAGGCRASCAGPSSSWRCPGSTCCSRFARSCRSHVARRRRPSCCWSAVIGLVDWARPGAARARGRAERARAGLRARRAGRSARATAT